MDGSQLGLQLELIDRLSSLELCWEKLCFDRAMKLLVVELAGRDVDGCYKADKGLQTIDSKTDVEDFIVTIIASIYLWGLTSQSSPRLWKM